MKLTEKSVVELSLRPGQNERQITDTALPCLRLRLRRTRKGITRTYIYKYDGGSFSLDVAGTTLAAARKWAGSLQAARRLGRDPAQERDAGRLQVEQTMGAVLPAYLQLKQSTIRPRPYGELERHLMKYLKPLHRLPLSAISTPTLSARLSAITHESGVTTSDNVRRSVHAFLVWAMRQGLIRSNPAIGVERRPLKSRDRVLDADEIRAIWESTAGPDDYSAIVRLLLLTGCRISEIGGLQWPEVCSDRIELPGERTKNGRAHVIPLVPQIAGILASRTQPSGRANVFGRNGDSAFVGWGASKAALDARIAAAGIKMKPWRHHDIRRTVATGLSELGTSVEVIETMLNHVSGFRRGVAGV